MCKLNCFSNKNVKVVGSKDKKHKSKLSIENLRDKTIHLLKRKLHYMDKNNFLF